MALLEARDYARQCAELLRLERLTSTRRDQRLALLRASEPELAATLEELARHAECEDDAWSDTAIGRRSLPSNPTEWIGPYRIERVIGMGGMGTVLACTQPAREGVVAVKLLHPYLSDGESRARREYEFLARMNHVGVVRALDVGCMRWNDVRRAYVVMEYVAGAPLSRPCDRSRVEVLELGLRMAEALQHVHEQGVIHGDLKPENILVDSCGRIVIVDFGIAHDPRGESAASGDTPGTFGFMAPELGRSPAVVTQKADVFSLGAVLFEQFAGRAAFEHPFQQPPWEALAPHPQALRGFLRRALALDPDERLPSAAAFATGLRHLLA